MNAQGSNRGTLEAGRECRDRESLLPFVRNRFQEAFYLIFKSTFSQRERFGKICATSRDPKPWDRGFLRGIFDSLIFENGSILINMLGFFDQNIGERSCKIELQVTQL